jgi:hypothetical protein
MCFPERSNPRANTCVVGEVQRQTMSTADTAASHQGREEDPARLRIDVGAPLRVTGYVVAACFIFCIFSAWSLGAFDEPCCT